MRSCIYCGKELRKGEVCNCSQSVKARAAKEADTQKTQPNQDYTQNNTRKTASGRTWTESQYQTTYRTGYTKTKKEPFFKRHKRKAHKMRRDYGTKKFFAGLREYMTGFAKDPVNSVINGAYLGKLQIIAIMILQSFVLAFAFSFASVRMAGRYAKLLILAGVNPMAQYSLGGMLLDSLFGTVFICGALFLLIGIFYLIHRFLFKRQGGFWDFSIRLVSSSIPMCLLGLLGIFAGLFSPYAMLILVLGGTAVWLVLVYESLCAEWSFMPKGRILYIMVVGFFVFLTTVMNFIRIFG